MDNCLKARRPERAARTLAVANRLTPRRFGIFVTGTSAPLPPEQRGMNELSMETALAACSGLRDLSARAGLRDFGYDSY